MDHVKINVEDAAEDSLRFRTSGTCAAMYMYSTSSCTVLVPAQAGDSGPPHPPHLPIRRQAARDGVSQERRRNVGEMAGEARFSREMAAARGLIGDPAQARRDSPDPGRRHDGRGHLAAIFRRRAGRAAAEKSCARLIQ